MSSKPSNASSAGNATALARGRPKPLPSTRVMRTTIFRRLERHPLKLKAILSVAAALAIASAHAQEPARWTAEKANAWYAQQPWLVGSNFVPSDAINQLDMFQAATWNPQLNDKELGMAESIGMNTMRVFLQDQLWEQDSEGFKKRLDAFLTIAS